MVLDDGTASGCIRSALALARNVPRASELLGAAIYGLAPGFHADIRTSASLS